MIPFDPVRIEPTFEQAYFCPYDEGPRAGTLQEVGKAGAARERGDDVDIKQMSDR